MKIQILIFCISSIAIFISLKPFYSKLIKGRDNSRAYGVKLLIGKTAKVIQKIEKNNPGRVIINGEDWRALAENGEEFDIDDIVIIKRIDSVTVFVEKQV